MTRSSPVTTMQLFATDTFDSGPKPEKTLAPAPAVAKKR